MPKLNLKGVGRREPVEDDTYECVVTGVKHDKVKSGEYQGSDRANVELTIDDGEHKGRKVYRSYMLHDDFLFIFKEEMLILGADEKMLEDEDADSEIIVKSVFGERCACEVSINEFTDPKTNELRRNNRVDRIREVGWTS